MQGFESQIQPRPQSSNRVSAMIVSALNVRLTFEMAVACMAIGIAIYFAWPREPSLWLCGAGLSLTLIAMLFLPDRFSAWPPLLAFLWVGLSWATLHTAMSDTNPLEAERRYAISGWVSDVDRNGAMSRLRIELNDITPMPETGRPASVRIRGGRAFQNVDVGDLISVDAVLGPFPGPAIPDGYDPARRAFYDGLAGSGFAIAAPVTSSVEVSVRARIETFIDRSRHAIANHVMQRAPTETAGLQAALLTGIRHHIPDEQTESLRASGLAHILAISGLHMGLVAFGIFVTTSFVLASVEPLSRGRDVRKISALVAIVFATIYLGLSGASVATQRAYIMVSVAFAAILLDRRALSMRSVAVAAFLTLLIRPEALTSVGFQMSFAAVAAMVVIFRAWDDWRPHRKVKSFRDRVTSFYGSLFGTSLVAGFATGGFALLHFGRFANYGLIANMAAMSVFPVVMALGIIALLLMPLGLDAAPLWLMSVMINFMLSVSDWVSGLPGAVGTVKASPPLTIAAYGLGFAMACFATRRAVSLGCLIMASSVLIWAMTPRADIRVSQSGRVSILSDQGAVTSSARADRYGREQFARSVGDPELAWSNYHDDFAECDAMGCRFTHAGRVISVVEAPSEVPEACEDGDIVILVARNAGPVARRGCAALLIDQRLLTATGGVHLNLRDQIDVIPIINPNRSNRPWGKGRRR